MNFRDRVKRLSKADKQHLRYVLGAGVPITKSGVIRGLRLAYKIQGSRHCSGCTQLQRKLVLEV